MIKATSDEANVLIAKAREAGQEHLFAHWESLSSQEQRALIDDLKKIDFQLVKQLAGGRSRTSPEAAPERVLEPPEVHRLPDRKEDPVRYRRLRALGEEALSQGRVALVMFCGNEGLAPLGEPAGFLPVGPVTGKSLFELQAEKVRALVRREKRTLRWYIVTYPDGDEEIRRFFKERDFFGLRSSDIVFLAQRLLPLLDRRGKFVLTAPGKLALRPVGEGGVLLYFLRPEVLSELREHGIEHLFFFHADNVLVKIADPVFVGHHIDAEAEVTSKAVRKRSADEDLATFCRASGVNRAVESLELSEEERRRKAPGGGLVFALGSIGVHLFSRTFLERLLERKFSPPFHAAEQRVECINRKGRRIRPTEPNCIQFKAYLNDFLSAAERSSIVEVEREDEFSPVLMTGGENSPQTAQRALSRLYLEWLKEAGAVLPESAAGIPPAVEISPLFALDEEELEEKIELPLHVEGPVLLERKKESG